MDSDEQKDDRPDLTSTTRVAALAAGAEPPMSGGCLEFRPTPLPRARVRWGATAEAMRERWVPVLHGLELRRGDVVLLLQPANMVEPIVAGVIDRLEDAEPTPGASGPGAVPVAHAAPPAATPGEAGLPIEVLRDLDEVVLRIGKAEVRVNLDTGRLRLAARWIQLVSEDGDVDISSDHDVVIKGNVIHLN